VFIVTVQVPVPLHAPPQLLKVQPLAGVAVSVTAVPGANLALQVVGQSMPPGELVTVPLPVSLTVNELAAFIANTVPTPAEPPL
jgi:hypothetical protein